MLIKKHKFSEDHRRKISLAMKGNQNGKNVKWTDERRQKAQKRTGEKGSSWKGEKVGYRGLHKWVRKILPKSAFCQECQNVPPIDLANKGIYDRRPENWEWLCRRCHMTKDGRLKALEKTWVKPGSHMNKGLVRSEETRRKLSETRKRLFAEGKIVHWQFLKGRKR